jgi:hypothetical protein
VLDAAAGPRFPSPAHERAVEATTAFLAAIPAVDAVLLTGSAARRSDANDLDITALVPEGTPADEVVRPWAPFEAASPELAEVAAAGPFGGIDLNVIDGVFAPTERGWTSGPDNFELDVGNEVAYSVVLWERSDRVQRLRERWLPYLDDELRASRLAAARKYCVNDLEHIPLMIARDEPFQAFHRLYHAFQEFLQALFIARRRYPISYDKWIREQVEELLGLPDLYAELPALVGVAGLDQATTQRNAHRLRDLLETWAPSER